jgi:hypothetical protein
MFHWLRGRQFTPAAERHERPPDGPRAHGRHEGMGQNNVRALGLRASQGILLLVPFYLDMSDALRAFARRFQERHPKRLMPRHAGRRLLRCPSLSQSGRQVPAA